MEGVIAAVPTPIDQAGQPQKEAFIEHCTWALANGCDGLNILGSTGEANSFGMDARYAIMEWAAGDLPTDRLMVGTGTPSLADTIALTERADDLGYGTALVLPPYYYKPATDAGLIAWYTALHTALGARDIAIYFYNFPQMTGITISQDVIGTLTRDSPNRFKGIKDSSGDLDYCRAVLKTAPDMCVFPSSETALATAAADGFAGCISATVNITATLSGQAWAARSAPNQATLDEMARVRGLIAGSNLVAGVKHLVGQRSANPIWNNILPPFMPLTDEQAATLEESLT